MRGGAAHAVVLLFFSQNWLVSQIPPQQMNMVAPQRVMARGTIPANVGMTMPPGGYGNVEQLMMVLNNGGGYQPMREYQPLGGRSPDNREFSMADSDFPALPASAPNGQGGPGQMGPQQPSPQQGPPQQQGPRKDFGPQQHYQMLQQMYGRLPQGYQQPQQPGPVPLAPSQQQQQQGPPPQQQGPPPQQQQQRRNGDTIAQHQYGLLGLLGLIRMTDRDLNTLALGTDLTTLGLNLNSSEMLYTSFASPFADNPVNRDPYHMPESYTIAPLTPPAHMLMLVSDETLLYSFYTSPKDMLQLHCARELYKRGWRFHKELQRWLLKIQGPDVMRVTTPAYDRGPYFIYDPATFEKVRNDNVLVVLEKLEQPEK
jgi:hypothetical protein